VKRVERRRALAAFALTATISHMRAALPVVLLAVTSALMAQERGDPRFRIGLSLAAGTFDYHTDGSNLDGDTDAGMFRLQFEGTSAGGIGGGIRLESIASDDDLFADAGFPASEAGNGSVFGHFTYRVEAHRFAMPIRAGLLLNGLTLKEKVSDLEVTYASIGPYFEIAPEVVLVRGGKTQWSLYAELGTGFAGTGIDVEGDPNDYSSVTWFAGLELGTRLLLGPIELGLSYVGRWQSMDESDPEGGLVVLPYDSNFQGVLFSLGVVF